MKSMNRKAYYLLAMLLWLPSTLALAAGVDPEGGGWPGYMELDPPIVVNLAAATRSKYLRADIQLYIENKEDADLVKEHMPRIRDRLISLLAGRDGSTLMTADARDALRAELLTALRETMVAQTGHAAISGLYFTGFIIQ